MNFCYMYILLNFYKIYVFLIDIVLIGEMYILQIVNIRCKLY